MQDNSNGPSYGYEIQAEIEKYKIKSAKRAFSRTLLAPSVYLLVSSAVIVLAELVLLIAFGVDGAIKITDSTYYVWIMQVLAAYVIAFPIAYLVLRKIPKATRYKTKMSLEEFVVIFFIGHAVMTVGAIISNTVVEFISAILGHEVSNAAADMIIDAPIWIVVLVAVIIGPIFEELLFRKFFIDRLSVYGDRLAIIVSSIAFGLFHGNLSQILYATAIGFIFGYVYAKTRDIRYSAGLHMLLNLVGTIPSLLMGESAEKMEEIFSKELLSADEIAAYYADIMTVVGVSAVQYALLAIGIGFAIYVFKKKLVRVPSLCDMRLPKERTVESVILNPGAIIFGVIALGEIALSLFA